MAHQIENPLQKTSKIYIEFEYRLNIFLEKMMRKSLSSVRIFIQVLENIFFPTYSSCTLFNIYAKV